MVDLEPAAFDLSAAIARVIANQETARRAEEEAQRLRQEREREARLRALSDAINAVVPPQILAAWGPLTYIHSTSNQALAHVDFDGVRYTLTCDRPLAHGMDVQLTMYAAAYDTAGRHIGRFTPLPLDGVSLADRIISYMADASTAAIAVRHRAEREAQTEARREAEHQRIVPEVERRKAEAAAALWQWPEGKELMLYIWRWCVAPASESGPATFDAAWSACPALKDGWLRTLSGSQIRLTPESLPTTELRVIASVEDLPITFVTSVTIPLPGIDVDGSNRYFWRNDAVWYVHVGKEPKDEIKRLLK